MAKETKKNDQSSEVHIITVERGKVTFKLLGTSPLMHNCLSNKARHELLLPNGPKSRVEKQTTLKHNPLEEFQNSIYFNNKEGPTLVQHLSSAFRGAMSTAAKDLPGTSKAEIGRLLWVDADRIDIYGIPMLDMRPVRQAGMNRTPDIRSRCIMKEWACSITISYVKPQLKLASVANLLAAAGMYIGIGDGRNEKGRFNYGLWEVVDDNNTDWQRIVAASTRKVQEAAMKEPEYFNEETEELYTWYTEAVKQHRSFAPLRTNGKAKPTLMDSDDMNGDNDNHHDAEA